MPRPEKLLGGVAGADFWGGGCSPNTCPPTNTTWSPRAVVAAECSIPAPASGLITVNVTVPATSSATTHVPRTGRGRWFIWDAHRSATSCSANRSGQIYPVPRGTELPCGVRKVYDEGSGGDVVIEHGPGVFWFVSSAQPRPPAPPPPPAPLPSGACNASGTWFGGTAKILITTSGNALYIDCPSAWG